MSEQRVIEVVADWVLLQAPTLMGRLTATPARGKEVFAYEYWAVNYSGAAPASFALEAYQGGSQRARFAGTLAATPRVESAHQRFTY